MDYPADDVRFHESVRIEAEQQLTLWDRHVSVAVVCGNSEVSQQAAMSGRPRGEWHPALFESTLRALTEEHCPGACYWPSSASGGSFPHQPEAGTSSYYGVGAYERELQDARLSGVTFATEALAFANIPENRTLSRMPDGAWAASHCATWKRRSPRDLGAGWDFDDVRDHYVRHIFGVDPVQLRHGDHARYLELGRQAIAETMTAAFTQWRRPRSRCGGALVWFLQDLWPGAGWGIVDSLGEPKSPWYALRRNLQPLWVGITDEGLNGLSVHLINERPQGFNGRIHLSLYRDGRQLLGRAEHNVSIDHNAGLTLNAVELLEGFRDLGYAYRFGPLGCDLIVATLLDEAAAVVGRAFHLPRTSLHATPRTDCNLQAFCEGLRPSGEHRLVVTCNGFARGVHVDIADYDASDQYFDLEPGIGHVLVLKPRTNATRPPSGFVTAINAAMPAPIQLAG